MAGNRAEFSCLTFFDLAKVASFLAQKFIGITKLFASIELDTKNKAWFLAHPPLWQNCC
jgi:hypothetical protein